MIHNILDKCKDVFIDSIHKLKSSDRRIALARVSKAIGKGGQHIVAKVFNVSRDNIRKGTHATLLLENGANIKDIQKRLWHSKIATTMDTYSHITDKMILLIYLRI